MYFAIYFTITLYDFWVLFTKSRHLLNRGGVYSKICMKGAWVCLLNQGTYLLNRGLLNRGLGVLPNIILQD